MYKGYIFHIGTLWGGGSGIIGDKISFSSNDDLEIFKNLPLSTMLKNGNFETVNTVILTLEEIKYENGWRMSRFIDDIKFGEQSIKKQNELFINEYIKDFLSNRRN
jgi:hypothetical protein